MTKEELLQTYFYIEDISGGTNTVSIKKYNSSAPTLNIEYSTDGITWSKKNMQTGTSANTFTIPANGKLYLRGVNNTWANNYYNKITASGKHNVGGNSMSLLYGSEFEGKTSFPTIKTIFTSLFSNNTTLVNAKDLQLPATTLASGCYEYMFEYCTSLTTAPSVLPATTLVNVCYYYMFKGCTSLTTAPELPATTLSNQCYSGMFDGCSSLTTAPELPATTLDMSCYENMFRNCSKLNYVYASFADTPNTNYNTYNWLSGVSSTGTFIMGPEAIWNPESYRGASGVPNGWNVKKAYLNTHICILNKSNNNNSLLITNSNNVNLEYSVDGENYNTLNGLTEINFNYGINIRGNNTSLDGLNFKTSKESSVKGNIMALLYGDEYEDKTTLPEDSVNTFKGLFKNNTNLIEVNSLQLPVNTVEGCYKEMFSGCTGLEKAPILPASTLTESCYQSMFQGCSSLNYININNLVNYSNENNEFTNWVNGVAEEGTIILPLQVNYNPEEIRGVDGIPNGWQILHANYFYIEDISGSENTVYITKTNSSAPTLNIEYSTDGITWSTKIMNEDITANTFTCPSNGKLYLRGVNNTWANNYYNKITASGKHNVGGNSMSLLYGSEFEGKTSFPTIKTIFTSLFSNNTTLVNAKDLQLPATTLSNQCYSGMFDGCSSLTTAPELPATTLEGYCYFYMFSDCISLTTAPELPATTLANRCYLGMFWGCSSLTTAPELPATTLAEACYSVMFVYCNSLTSAPALPATTLDDECYNQMFIGSSKLNCVYTLFTDTPNTNDSTLNWLSGVSSTGTFVMSPNATWNPESYRGASGVPNGWNVCTPNQRGVTIVSTNTNYGTVNDDINGGYNLGDTITITAVPTYKGKFIKWSDGVTDYNRTIEITEDLPYHNEYTAIFEEVYGIHFINESENTNTLTVTNNGKNLHYTTDGITWTDIVEGTTSIEFKDGITIKGNNISLNGVKFNNSEYTTVGGNLLSLLYNEDINIMSNIIPEDSVNTFKYLFLGNTNLTDISTLVFPENTVPHCYQHMFTGCKSLKSIPKLPANDLTNSCYHGMFMDCDGINTVNLPVQYLAPYAYSNMFLGSNNLNKVITEFIEFDKTSLKGWLKDTAEEGTLYLSKDYPYDIEETTDMLYVPIGWDVMIKPDINYLYIEDISGSDTQIGISMDYLTFDAYKNGMLDYLETLNLEYSYNKVHWNTVKLDFDNGITWIDLPSNSKVYLRGNNKSWNAAIRNAEFLQEINDCTYEDILYEYTWGSNQQIVTLSECNVGGDILTLMYGEEIPDTIESKELDGAFMHLFSSYEDWNGNWYESYVVDASELILPDVVGIYTYGCMFYSCTYLTATPALPATSLAEECYYGMFSGCTNLTTAPELPATTLDMSCYSGMFRDCTSLTTAPELPATTLASGCYQQMFEGCNSLTTAPELPATTLYSYCYGSMFWKCTSLTTAPELPATTLADTCYNGMFSGCTSLTTAPSVLPATTLADTCYHKMFYNCVSLTTAPELPATTLVVNCYYDMFNGCIKLNYVCALFTSTPNTGFTTHNWLSGVSSTGTFVMSPNATWNPESYRGKSGIPEGWTVTTK